MSLDVEKVRRDFPILHQEVHKKPLVYLDNAATTQKPHQVIEAMKHYYEFDNANVHRGVHTLSERATLAYENSREKVQNFLGARSSKEIIFVRGVTEGINLLAYSFGRKNIRKDDEIIISVMEHHSNIVPWQLLCEETGAKLKVVAINNDGEFVMSDFERLLSSKTKLVSLVHMSNALGTINPVREIINRAHALKIPVHLDGAQAVSHIPVDVQELDCDFYTFSGHKLYGPTGIGVLFGKEEFLEEMPPFMGGGDMISSVSFDKTTFNTLPYKFEAGTPSIASAIGLGAAIDYVTSLGLENIAAYEQDVLNYATEKLLQIPNLKLIGTAKKKASVLSFILKDIHPHDIGTILDREGIAIRTGHHCAQPVMTHFDIPATARASIGIYNTKKEIDILAQGIERVMEVFK